MRLIQSNVNLLGQEEGIKGIYRSIERAGRVCYKSEDNITDESAGAFVNKLIHNKHYAMLEHGTVYLSIKRALNPDDTSELSKYKNNPYSKYNEVIFGYGGKGFYVTTNYRVLVENGWFNDLSFMCEPTEFHEKRYTAHFITSIGIVRELLRHRVFSFANESTRYCNYSKGKFNQEVTFIEPNWIDSDREIYSEAYDNAYELLVGVCEEAEGYYITLLDNGFNPQDAREFLPLCTKSELVMTGFESDWKHFFDLRLFGKTGAPHPDMKILAQQLYDQITLLYEKTSNNKNNTEN